VKLEKGNDNAIESDLNQGPDGSKYCVYRNGGFSCNDVKYIKDKEWDFACDTKGQRDNDVEEEKHEELSIRKSDAIRNPWTVMIHIKYATLTG
jgi:hypothetical protein